MDGQLSRLRSTARVRVGFPGRQNMDCGGPLSMDSYWQSDVASPSCMYDQCCLVCTMIESTYHSMEIPWTYPVLSKCCRSNDHKKTEAWRCSGILATHNITPKPYQPHFCLWCRLGYRRTGNLGEYAKKVHAYSRAEVRSSRLVFSIFVNQ